MNAPTTPAALEVSGVTLVRRIAREHTLDLKRSLFAWAHGRYQPPERRTVLHDVSLRVERGERFGIIGPNGAGKSTLLKVIAGILPVSTGVVRVDGVVAPLIELGAGFDPELSVFDNVVAYGVMLGYSRESMRERMDTILAFAQLEAARTSLVKTLSSGMTARLGFAVATDIHPDVLLVDEVLAVGDQWFRARSRERIESLWRGGTTSIIVSHDLGFVAEECHRAACLDRGRVAFIGAGRAAVRFYLDVLDDGRPGSASPRPEALPAQSRAAEP